VQQETKNVVAAIIAIGIVVLILWIFLVLLRPNDHGSAAKLLAEDEAQRITANIAKLPELCAKDGATALLEFLIAKLICALQQRPTERSH
jgi:hypothetical protein